LLFTILLPIHRPPVFLPLSVDTVLRQTVDDFELFIVCDGAPPETAACAKEFERQDPRIKAFVHPKGERHGELWRHAALEQARGKYVAHINDDDLWFPHHLEELAVLLAEADFGNLPLINVDHSGQPCWWPGDLHDEKVRARILTSRFNIANLTVVGYRLEAYRKLPVGWSPAPPDVWSDHFMWRKFLSGSRELVCSTRFTITALHFPDPEPPAMTLDDKYRFTAAWRARIADPKERDSIVQETIRGLLASHAELSRAAHSADWVFQSKSWKVTAPLRWISKVLTLR
jgi:glycosyltransferase involved in cell wall biosynthesis